MADAFQADSFQNDAFEASSATYTLSITAGVYTQTGNGVTLTPTYRLSVTAGVYAQTGNAVSLGGANYTIEIEAGVYAQTGNTVSLDPTYRISITPGTYAQTGNAVGLVPTYRLTITAGVYEQFGEDVELLWAKSEEYTLNFIVDLYPAIASPTSQSFGERLTVGGRVLKVKSWSYDEGAQAIAGTLQVELANVADRHHVTRDNYLKFEIWNGSAYETLIDTGQTSQSDYVLSPIGIGRPDTFTLSGFSNLMVRLNKVPSTTTIVYDSARHSFTVDDFEGVYDQDNNYTQPVLVPNSALKLYTLLDYVFVTRCGFSQVKTNIPNFPIAVADFAAGKAYTQTINGIIGMFSPDYSAVGDVLWIRDGTTGSPAGFPAPRSLTVSNAQQIALSAEYNRIDSLMLDVTQERLEFDYYTDRTPAADVVEVGALQPFQTTFEEITISTTYRDYFRASRPSTPVKSEVKRIVRTSRPNGGATISHRSTEDFIYDSLGRLTRRTKATEALVPNPNNNFALQLLDVLEESEKIVNKSHPFEPRHYYLASREVNIAGLVFVDAENQQLGEDYSRDVLNAYRSGNVVDTMTSYWGKISTYREEITPKRNRKIKLRTIEKDYLANQYTIDVDEERDGEVGVNIFVTEQRQLRIFADGKAAAILGEENVNMGELPLDIALSLGYRILNQRAAFASLVRFDLIGLDNTLQKGQPFNAVGRSGADLGNYIIEGRSLSGSPGGYFQQIQARQSV